LQSMDKAGRMGIGIYEPTFKVGVSTHAASLCRRALEGGRGTLQRGRRRWWHGVPSIHTRARRAET